MKFLSIPIAVASLALAAFADPRSVGMWAHNPAWPVEQFGSGEGGFCLATTAPQARDGERYQVGLKVGRPSAIILRSSQPLSGDRAAIEFPDGGGYDFMDLTPGRAGADYTITASLSGSMMSKLVQALRSQPNAVLVLNGKGYWLPTKDFETTFADLKKCESHRVGLILGD